MSMPERTWRQRLGYGLLLLAVVATVGMLVLAIVLALVTRACFDTDHARATAEASP